MRTVISSPIGYIEVEQRGDVLTELSFQLVAASNHDELMPNVESADSNNLVLQQLAEYLAGERKTFDFNWSFNHAGTDFQKSVWQTIAEIPYGEVMSYKEIAETIGRPRAYRAVANACGKNFLPVVVPCHRVVGSGPVRNGKPTFTLGGYSSGLDKKRWLMDLEGIQLQLF
jgi:methylated-DNA-[protein]-cysteine S-methyltransferase